MKWRDLATNLLVLAGFGLVAAGCWWVLPPLGLVVGGVCLLVLAWVVGR